MKDILEQIIATKREELAAMRAKKPSLREALLRSESGIIAEFKRRSPSKGWIKEEGRADVIPLSYQQNGAAALSILTDRQYFGGHDRFITEARLSGVTLPVLYKNFVIDEMQLYEAALCGASAVLLIAACLTKQECQALMEKAHGLGLEVLLEMHSEGELEYAELQPDLCGINNRNLGSFVTDVENSFLLAEKLRAIAGITAPEGSEAAENPTQPSLQGGDRPSPFKGSKRVPLLISESGISSPQTIRELRQAGFRGFLIGETFMKAPDPGKALKQFIEQL
ncbi:MAG: indole-3-glycerol phosphate synthase TrpC [Prevotella sp.]|nr:indole-3-glycerol phosphate synthase TrpC [Prevotella sp.]